MKQKEIILRQKIKRRSDLINKLEAEISRYADILAMCDENCVMQKKWVGLIKKYRQKRDEAVEEKKILLSQLTRI